MMIFFYGREKFLSCSFLVLIILLFESSLSINSIPSIYIVCIRCRSFEALRETSGKRDEMHMEK